jgi:PKD repeat protein
LWDFGDGNTSTVQNANHTYIAAGNYTVNLTATNIDGSNSTSKAGYITVTRLIPPVANFTANVTTGRVPLAVQFTDLSTGSPISWLWDFGDGNTSTVQNANHVYMQPGNYTVNLTATNSDGSNSTSKADYITVTRLIPPVTNFTANVTSGRVPLAVQFNDTSTGSPNSWTWDFGDLSQLNTTQNATHVYTQPGNYTVNLTATNSDGNNSTSKAGYITVTRLIPPVTNFTSNVTSGRVPLAVQFNDTSTGSPNSWTWDFGDGNTSTVQNANHTYIAAGNYTVNLTATNSDGSNSTSKADYITVTRLIPPVVNFASNVTAGPVPLAVRFNDTSTGSPNSWLWDFGDGNTSTVQNANHTYIAAGNYTVNLTATNSDGSNSTSKAGYITVTRLIPPVANFTANITTGRVPLAVQFNDTSAGSPILWTWDFGDLSPMNTTQNATHVYTQPGNYTVNLTATNSDGSNSTSKAGYITVTRLIPPVANFTANVTVGPVPLAVQFNDTSTGSPNSWSWDFGDGNTSTVQNANHVYTQPGNYTVNLTATNSDGSNSTSKAGYITVTSQAPPSPTPTLTPTPSITAGFYAFGHVGQAPYSVRFLDQSTGSPTTWKWDFGDGTTSTEQSPTHVYNQTGAYNVALTASNDQATDTAIQYRCVIVNTVPVANFTANVTAGRTPLTVQFTDQSTSATGYQWQFGDGQTSTEQNPVHTYSHPGSYTVMLTAYESDYGSVYMQKPGYITVTDPPTVGFSANVTAGLTPLAVQFNESINGSVQYYYWQFGDGSTSFDRNPVHVYDAAGGYTVSLYAIGSNGTEVKTADTYITVTDPVIPTVTPAPTSTQIIPVPVADFTVTTNGPGSFGILVTDTSVNATSVRYDLGDVTTTAYRTFRYTYSQAGTYTIKQVATSAAGSSNKTISVTIPATV